VWVGASKLPGVIGMKPIHLIKGAERESVVKIDSLRIDIGATSRDAAARSVKPGACYGRPLVRRPNLLRPMRLCFCARLHRRR